MMNRHGEESARGRSDDPVTHAAKETDEGRTVLIDLAPRSAKASSADQPVADLDEFKRVLIELGLSTVTELAAYEVDPALGLLGLARSLVRAGRLTPYQSAAIYQKKSRGLLIGGYVILDKLGQGGMGVVFKARQRATGQIVALKLLPPSFARSRQAVVRFKREIAAANRLNHPNIAAALDADEDRGAYFLIMDYVEGLDLDRLVQANGPMPVDLAVDCLIQAARGLEAAHAQGIVHRDIKPANLMRDAAGLVRVLDLGLARMVETTDPFQPTTELRLTQSGMCMGTIDFMAPEQAEDSRQADHRADIYSLGCTLYYLLTGREPFEGETMFQRLVAHREHPAPKLSEARPDVPQALEMVFHRMLAKQPAERPASMTELIKLLESCRTPAAEPRGPADRPLRSRPEIEVSGAAALHSAGRDQTEPQSSTSSPREGPDAFRTNADLRPEDLLMNVRPDNPATFGPTGRQAPRPRLERPGRERPQRKLRDRITRIKAVALGSVAVLGIALGGFILLPWIAKRAPRPQPKSENGGALVREINAAPFEDPETPAASDRPRNTPTPEEELTSPEETTGFAKTVQGTVVAAADIPKRAAPTDRPSLPSRPATPKRVDSKSPALPPPLPQWAILGDSSRYFARNIPDDALARIEELAQQGKTIKWIAFSPSGGWVILFEKNGYDWKDIPDGTVKRLGDLATKGADLKSVTFTPTGGWTILFDWNGNLSEGIPEDTLRALLNLLKRGVEIKAVAYTQNGGSAILFGRNGYYARKVPDEVLKALGSLAKDGAVLKSISFTPDGGWLILHGPSGFVAGNIPKEAFKVLRNMANEGEVRSLCFPVLPLNRLSRDDAATREAVLTRMAQYKVPGLGIALVNQGQIAWARGYGITSATGSQPVTERTRFQAASISKLVVAVAALRLVEQGKLELDQPLSDRLVSWKVAAKDFTKVRKPTLRQVLSHSAGFTASRFGGYSTDAPIPTLRDVLDGTPPANSPAIRVESIPGTKFQYSGGGYVVLQQLIVDVTGKPFAAAIKELVLDPADMTQSSLEQPPGAELERYAADGHVNGVPLGGRWHVYPELAAAGLWTTPSDLARLLIRIQQSKKGSDQPLLSSAMIGEMLRTQSGDAGLGVFLGGSGRFTWFFQNGENAGFQCLLVGFAEIGHGAVVMINASGSFGVIQEVISHLSADYDWPG
jgi:serine/threonine protein kinase/CubicO group peptidase (beta-lactamase class C family)